MIVSLLVSLAALGVVLRLVFALAVYALPFFIGLSSALWAQSHGSGVLGAAAVGLAFGALAFAVGHLLATGLRSPVARAAVGAVYAAPAGIAGYHLVHGLSGGGGAGDGWRVAFAMIGAVVVAGIAWKRLAEPRPGGPGGSSRWSAPVTSGASLGATSDR